MSFPKIHTALLSFFLCLALAAPAVAAEIYGRVIAYDAAGQQVTFIEDSLGWSNPKRPEFTVLPPKVVTLSEDPGAMAPKAGGRLRIDLEKKEIIIFNATSQQIETIPVEVISNIGDIEPDNAQIAGKVFPIIDKDKGEITIYSKRQKSLSTIKVPQNYMELADDTWDDGHNIALSIGQDGKGSAFVNLSRAAQ